MSLISTIVKYATKFPRIESYERFLFIGPHPDDIEIGAGATAAKLASIGKKVTFLICLDGRYGDGFLADKSEEDIIAIRKNESINSAKMLGINDVKFLDLCDGGFYNTKELVKGIANVVGEVNPDIIFAPDFFVASECHEDHLNVAKAARKIAYFAPYKSIMERLEAKSADVKALAMYMTAKPNQFIDTRKKVRIQLDSIFKCHTSQFPKGTPEANSLDTYIKLRSKIYGPRRFSTDCEGFRVLYTTHMHCLPEASLF